MQIPYIAGPSIENPENFFGRNKQIQFFFRMLNNQRPLHPLKVVGFPRSGKTSFLRYISNPEIISRYSMDNNSQTIIAYVDLEGGIDSPQVFYTAIKDAINSKIPQKLQLNEFDTAYRFGQWIDSLKTKGYRIIVLLDEFDSIINSGNFDIFFFRFMRSLISDKFVWVISLKKIDEKEIMNHLLSEKTSYFFNQFYQTPIYMGQMELNEAIDLLSTPAKTNDILLTQDEIHSIIQIAGKFPYILQSTATQWLQTRQTEDDFTRIPHTVIEELSNSDNQVNRLFKSNWKRFSSREKECLIASANHFPIQDKDFDIYNTLQLYGFVEKEGETFTICGELMKRLIIQQNIEPTPEIITVPEINQTPPLHILHLSDLHIRDNTDPVSIFQPLKADLNDTKNGMHINKLDFLIITGDFTESASETQFQKAAQLIDMIKNEFQIPENKCIFCPGNHDIDWNSQVYRWKNKRHVSEAELKNGSWLKTGELGYLIREDEHYFKRFYNFSNHLYKPFNNNADYPPTEEEQCIPHFFPEQKLLIFSLNSCYEIDEFFPSRSGISNQALTRGLMKCEQIIKNAIRENQLAPDEPLLKIVIWHHPVTGNDRIIDDQFLHSLTRARFKICLHGHIHDQRTDLFNYTDPDRSMHIVGAGTFDAPQNARLESIPRLYNLLRIDYDKNMIRVFTRCKLNPHGTWAGWAVWPGNDNQNRYYYDISLR